MSGDHYCTLDKEKPNWTCLPGRKYGHTYHSSIQSCEAECGPKKRERDREQNIQTRKECIDGLVVSAQGGFVLLVIIMIIYGLATDSVKTVHILRAFEYMLGFRPYRFINNNINIEDDELLHLWTEIISLQKFKNYPHASYIRKINKDKNNIQDIKDYIIFLMSKIPIDTTNKLNQIMKNIMKQPEKIIEWANEKINELIKEEENIHTSSLPVLIRAGNSLHSNARNMNELNHHHVLAFKSKRKSGKKSKRV